MPLSAHYLSILNFPSKQQFGLEYSNIERYITSIIFNLKCALETRQSGEPPTRWDVGGLRNVWTAVWRWMKAGARRTLGSRHSSTNSWLSGRVTPSLLIDAESGGLWPCTKAFCKTLLYGIYMNCTLEHKRHPPTVLLDLITVNKVDLSIWEFIEEKSSFPGRSVKSWPERWIIEAKFVCVHRWLLNMI